MTHWACESRRMNAGVFFPIHHGTESSHFQRKKTSCSDILNCLSCSRFPNSAIAFNRSNLPSNFGCREMLSKTMKFSTLTEFSFAVTSHGTCPFLSEPSQIPTTRRLASWALENKCLKHWCFFRRSVIPSKRRTWVHSQLGSQSHPIRQFVSARQNISLLWCPRFLGTRIIANLTAWCISSRTFASLTCGSFLGELIIGYGCTCQVLFHIFDRTEASCLLTAWLPTPRITASAQARVPTRRTPICVRESFHRSVNMFVSGQFRTTSLKSCRLFVEYLTGLFKTLRLLGSMTPNMHKCEISSSTKGALRSLFVAPTFFKRILFPIASCISSKDTTHKKMLTLPPVLYQSALSLNETWAWLRTGDQTRLGNVKIQSRAFSKRWVMIVIANIQKLGSHNKKPSAYCRSSNCLGITENWRGNKIRTLTEDILDVKNRDSLNRPRSGRVQELRSDTRGLFEIRISSSPSTSVSMTSATVSQNHSWIRDGDVPSDSQSRTPTFNKHWMPFFTRFSFVFSNQHESSESTSSVMQTSRGFWCREPLSSITSSVIQKSRGFWCREPLASITSLSILPSSTWKSCLFAVAFFWRKRPKVRLVRDPGDRFKKNASFFTFVEKTRGPRSLRWEKPNHGTPKTNQATMEPSSVLRGFLATLCPQSLQHPEKLQCYFSSPIVLPKLSACPDALCIKTGMK